MHNSYCKGKRQQVKENLLRCKIEDKSMWNRSLQPSLGQRHGVLNFLLSNGDVQFAHCSDRLWYIVRQAPFTKAHLVDEDVAVDFSELTTPSYRVAVIATLPPTHNETCTALEPGELAVFRNGERLVQASQA